MTYTQALHDAQRVSLALGCRVAVLHGGKHLTFDWKGERKGGGFDVPPGWRIASVINRGELESRG